jgi:hypothetical protein
MLRQPSSSVTKKFPVILIGENHLDPISKEVIIELMPLLKQNNYAVYFEFNSEKSMQETRDFYLKNINNSEPNDRILEREFNDFKNFLGEDFEEVLQIAHFFINPDLREMVEGNGLGEGRDINKKDRFYELVKKAKEANPSHSIVAGTEEQIFNYFIFELVKKSISNKGSKDSGEVFLRLLDKLEESGVPHFNIDLPDLDRTSKGMGKLRNLLEERDDYMVNKILDLNQPCLVLVGAAHLLGLKSGLSGKSQVETEALMVIDSSHSKFLNKDDVLTPYAITLLDFAKPQNNFINHLSNLITIGVASNVEKYLQKQQSSEVR